MPDTRTDPSAAAPNEKSGYPPRALATADVLAAALSGEGRRRALADGQPLALHPCVVYRVREGGLGVFAAHHRLCLAWNGPGAVIAPIEGSGDADDRFLQAVGATVIEEIERARLDKALEELETERWLHGATQRALVAVQSEAACIADHRLDGRTVKWVLRLSDPRLVSLKITQERLSAILGVQRTTINGVMQRFTRAGLLRSRRGKVTLFDREALRAHACACRSQSDRPAPPHA